MEIFDTLDEAAAVLNGIAGMPPTSANTLLRAGAAGQLLICVPLDTRAYSPTVRDANDEAAEKYVSDPQGIMERATVQMHGLYVVPPRNLLMIERDGEAVVEMVTSLDGAIFYKPFVRVQRHWLRVQRQHLEAYSAVALAQATSAVAAGLAVASSDEEPRVYWRRVLKANISMVDKAFGGKATPRQAIKWLRERKDRRIPDVGGDDELTWIDQYGGRQQVVKSSVGTALSEFRRQRRPPNNPA